MTEILVGTGAMVAFYLVLYFRNVAQAKRFKDQGALDGSK